MLTSKYPLTCNDVLPCLFGFNIHRRTDGTVSFPTLFLATSAHDIPFETDLFFTKPAALPIAWNPA
ncbi:MULTISPECIES: hypothetical protein [unclassified Streptomyces]|uniref:hypothetical protein n=1 Tax=unclassified Streptomyces TaxID=2593676 RepID=UPI00037E2EFC|nr:MULTISPECIES: hypothetical protein [unclassified Streptomyces]MYT33915.1 hypothetical protein [Streptomyces sp. SID8354]